MSEDSKDVRRRAAKPNYSEGWGNSPIWSADEHWFLRNRGQDMCLLASPRHFRGLVIVPFLAVMLAFPASAQTSSDSETQSTATAGARAQSELKAGPTSSNPATPKTGSNTVTPSTKTNSTAAEPNLSLRSHSLNPILESKRLALPSSSTSTRPTKK